MSAYTSRTGQAAALERWAMTADRAAATERARNAQWLGYERKVDPDGVLPEKERHRRAAALQRAHMLRMVEARLAKRGAA